MEVLIQWPFDLYNFLLPKHPLSPLSRDFLYHFQTVLEFVVIPILEVLRLLLTVSLAFLGLHILRNQFAKTSMVFSFCQVWQPLSLLGLVFYLLNLVIHSGTYYLFKDISLFNDNTLILNQIFPMISGVWRTSLFVFLYTYFIIVFFMASLLILDKKIGCKTSLCIAFKAIHQYLIKNIVFIVSILLVGLGYMSAGSGIANLTYIVFYDLPFFLFILMPGVFMAISLILYKEIAYKTGQHLVRKLALIVSFALLVFAILYFSARCADIYFLTDQFFLFALLVSFFITMLLILYKKITIKKIQHLTRNVALITLFVILGLVISVLFLTGVGLIWLLPVIALSIAMQYQRIFPDKNVSYV